MRDKKPRKRRPLTSYRYAVLVVVLALIFAACGDGDGADTTDGGTTETTSADPGGGTDGGDDLPPEVQAAADEAESLGLEFITSREELLACAEEEGSVVVQTSTAEFEEFEALFVADYPFLEMEWAELSGAATERFLLEVESGAAGRYDAGYPAPEAYNEIADQMIWDILGMAEAGILNIPIGSIDADNRTVVAAGHTGIAFAYNSELIDESELPTTWEELADPRWSRDNLGMAMDVDLNNVSVLATSPDWGIERVVELMESIAANEPIYVDGHTSAALLVQSGEVAASPFVNLHSLMREVDKDPDGPLQVHFIEPVPIRASEAYGVFNEELAEAPCAALLFIEWISNDDDAQALLDADPLQASLFWEESRMAEMIGDLEPTIADPEVVAALPDWIQQIQEAAGFPQVSG